MVVLIAASNKDVASKNIANKLIKLYNFRETGQRFQGNRVYTKAIDQMKAILITINDELVFSQYITDFFKPNLIIYVSRHQSQSGKPTLLVHTPGNLGEAKAGGIGGRVSIAPANPLRRALKEMYMWQKKMRLDEYRVSYEGTHHGPSLDVAAMFIEVGSTINEWKDLRATEVAAHAVIAAIKKGTNVPVALGIGGPHYNRKFTELSVLREIAFGHIIPKYAVHLVDVQLLNHCLEQTLERVEIAVLDWKGISSKDKNKVVDALQRVSVEVKRVKDLEQSLKKSI